MRKNKLRIEYMVIPGPLLETGMPLMHIVLLCFLKFRCHKEGQCLDTNAEIGNVIGGRVGRTIRMGLEALKEKGFILVTGDPKLPRAIKITESCYERFFGTASIPESRPKREEENFHGGEEENVRGGRKKTSGGRARVREEDINVSKEEKEPPISPSGGMTAREMVRTLYDLYPKHVKPRRAAAAIGVALGLKSFEYLEDKVRQYATSRIGQDAKFTPAPDVWFTQGRYDDDPKEWLHTDGPVDTTSLSTKLKALQDMIRVHPANKGAPNFRPERVTKKDSDDLRDLISKLRVVQRKIAQSV